MMVTLMVAGTVTVGMTVMTVMGGDGGGGDGAV